MFIQISIKLIPFDFGDKSKPCTFIIISCDFLKKKEKKQEKKEKEERKKKKEEEKV